MATYPNLPEGLTFREDRRYGNEDSGYSSSPVFSNMGGKEVFYTPASGGEDPQAEQYYYQKEDGEGGYSRDPYLTPTQVKRKEQWGDIDTQAPWFKQEFFKTLQEGSGGANNVSMDQLADAWNSSGIRLGSGSNPYNAALQVLRNAGLNPQTDQARLDQVGQQAVDNSPEGRLRAAYDPGGFMGLGGTNGFLGLGDIGDFGARALAAYGVGTGLNSAFGAGGGGAIPGFDIANPSTWGGGLQPGYGAATAGSSGLGGYNYVADAGAEGEGTFNTTVNTVTDGVSGSTGGNGYFDPNSTIGDPRFGGMGGGVGQSVGGGVAAGADSSIWSQIFNGITKIPGKIGDNFENNPLGAWSGAATLASSLFGKGGMFGDQGLTGAKASSMADPFGTSRPMYANQLNELMANPSLSMATPGYQFAREAGQQRLDRLGAKAGQNFSGNQAEALNNYNQNYALGSYNDQIKTLAGLAGANQNPANASSAYLSAQQQQMAADQNMWKSLSQGIGGIQGLVGPVQNKTSPGMNFSSDQMAAILNAARGGSTPTLGGYNPYGFAGGDAIDRG